MIKKDYNSSQNTFKTLRGGSFSNDARNVRSSDRDNDRPGGRLYNDGLRIAMEIKRIEK